MNNFEVTLFTLILVLLILLSAFFSCAETGLMAINRYRLRHKARLKKSYAVHLLKLLKRPDQLLGAILIGSTTANILASSLATLIGFYYLGDKGAFLAAILLTMVILIFSEIAPKTLAAIYPDQVSRWVVYPIKIILFALYPIVWLTSKITNGLLNLLHIKVGQYSVEPLTREELRSVVYDTTGKISRQYQNMLLGILDLNKLTVDDVMIPRHEIIGIDLAHSWEAILERIQKFYQEDWLPVYRENMNQLVGVLYARDLLQLLIGKRQLNKELLEQHLQDPYFVPEGTSLYVQLGYFQQSHDKVAFVVDEYGEIQGLLTLDTILEEIVGTFTPRLSLSKRIVKQPDHSYLVDGAVTVREFNRVSEWALPLKGPRTVNGLIVEYLEALPYVGTTVLIHRYPIEIMQVKDNRVKLAKIFPKLKEESMQESGKNFSE